MILGRVFTDPATAVVTLPADAPERWLITRYLRNENFLREFAATQAVTVHYVGPEGKFHLVLLNMARAAEWGAHEEAILGHELGHIWLYAQQTPSPVYEEKADSCVTIHAGDILEHVLIREELQARGIDYPSYWRPQAGAMLDQLEAGAGPAEDEMPVCRLMALLSLWLDARLGLDENAWNRFDDFEARMSRQFPRLRPLADELTRRVGAADLHDYDTYLAVLKEVLIAMYRYADALALAGRPM